MESYLSARNLLSVVLYPCESVKEKVKMSDAEYKAWLVASENRCEKADVAREAASTKAEKTNLLKDADFIFQKNLEKCRRAADILLNSFHTKQIQLVTNVFPVNPNEMWRIINLSYAAMQNTSNAQSLLKSLIDNKKKPEERVREYLSRTDTIITKLKQHEHQINEKMRVQYIILGLSNDAKFNLATQVLMSLNTENNLTSEKLESHLLAEEQRLETENERKSERALTTEDDNDKGAAATAPSFHPGHDNSRGRGNWRGRGRGVWHGRGRGRGSHDSYRGHSGRGNSVRGRGRGTEWRGGQAQSRGGHNNNNNNNSNRKRSTPEEPEKWLETCKCNKCGGVGHTFRYCPSGKQYQKGESTRDNE
jgi:hypothetical protein